MTRDFFIRLAFATHRVADALPQEDQVAKEIREAANTILVELILLCDKEFTVTEKKQNLLFQLEKQLEALFSCLARAKREEWVKAENFTLLETEYAKLRELLGIFKDISPQQKQKKEEVKDQPKEEIFSREIKQEEKENSVLTQRQKRILEFLRLKEKAQVWELQKVLPEVTKRTLRRDLDELLQKNLVARKGAWNAVSYELK